MAVEGDYRDVEALKDERGRRLYSPPRMSVWKALLEAFRAAWSEYHKMLGAGRAAYRKARQKGIPHLYRTPIPSATLTAAEEAGVEIDEGVDPDDVEIVIYRNSDGYLFTDDMLDHMTEVRDKSGKLIGYDTPGGYRVRQDRFTRAMYANMDQAQGLIDEYEALEQSEGLNDEQKQILAILKRKLKEDIAKRDVA